MRRLLAALAPTVAAYAWRNRDQISQWWQNRNTERTPQSNTPQPRTA